MGQAIDDAEHGAEHPSAKALKGFGGRGALEIVDDFQGIATPQREIDLIKARLKRAEEHYKANYVKGTKT
jgi:phage-related protein